MAQFVKLSIFGTVFEVTSRYTELSPVGMGAFGFVHTLSPPLCVPADATLRSQARLLGSGRAHRPIRCDQEDVSPSLRSLAAHPLTPLCATA